MTEPRIYAACLAAYNSGRLHGVWIDLAGKSGDDIRDEIDAMLARSPEPNVTRRKCDDCGRHYDTGGDYSVAMAEQDCPRCGSGNASAPFPSAEEWAIHDHEGLDPFIKSEWPDLDELAELAEMLDEDEPAKRFGAIYITWNGGTLREALDKCGDVITRPMEGLDTLADIAAEEFGESYAETLEKLPDWLAGHIDWKGVAYDLQANGDYVEVETAGVRFAVLNGNDV